MISALPVQCIFDNTTQNDFLLTVAIPTYKRFDLLNECLKTLSQCEFTFPIEIIVVDNDPEDLSHAHELIERQNIADFRYYKNSENYGMFGNWNQCLNLARGKYVTLLHDDDVLNSAFSRAMNGLVSSGELQAKTLVGFNVGILDQRHSSDQVRSNGLLQRFKAFARRTKTNVTRTIGLDDLLFSNVFQGTLGVVMLRDNAIIMGGFDETMYPISDYDFWVRWVTLFGDITIKPDVVGLYRIQKNESLRAEVIQGFINKNVEMRKRIFSSVGDSFVYRMFIKAKKLNDKLDCDYQWAGSGNKFGLAKSVFYMFVKISALILLKIVKMKMKQK